MDKLSPRATVRWIASSSSPSVASTRIRVLSVIKGLRVLGIDAALLSGDEPSCDVAVFCKTYRDEDIALATRLKRSGAVIAFDLCDNHFVLGDAVLRRLREMMTLANVWIFSTSALQRVAQRYLPVGRRAHVISDAVEVEQAVWEPNTIRRLWNEWKFVRWNARSGICSHPAGLRLLWFGNHAGSAADSGMMQLRPLRAPLERCAKDYGATLTIVSDSWRVYRQLTDGWGIRTFYFTWNISTFLRVLSLHSVALMPFANTEFNSVKSNNRLALSLYHGVAVVADGIPSYREFEACTFLDDWNGIEKYLTDDGLRRRHVEVGRAIVAEKYMPSNIHSQWASVIKDLSENKR